MRYRHFADTDIKFSEITFGTSRFVPKFQTSGGEEGQDALHAAIDMGINTIHSSTDYGTSWALEPALRNHPKRHDLRHITKLNVPDNHETQFDKARFRSVIEQSLRELHTEQITVVQHLQRGLPKAQVYDEASDSIRIAAMPTVNEALFEIFDKLREEGKVEHLAFFPHTHDFAAAAIAHGGFKGMVWFYNLIQTEMSDLMPEMADKNIALFAMRPYLEGVITDKRHRRNLLSPDDPKLASSWDSTYDRFELIKREIQEEILSWTKLAVGFVLANPLVPTAIMGMRTRAQVQEACATIDGNYPDLDFVKRIHKINSREGLIKRQL